MRVRLLSLLLLLPVALPVQGFASAQAPAQSQALAAPTVMSPAQLQDLIPATVFFAGKSATTQVRNSGGVRSGEDRATAFVLVDASGYSSGIRERYQFYLLTSVPMEIAGKRLPPGAYGGGFVNGQALFMDLGAKDILRAALTTDAEMKRPRPLQVQAAGNAGEYRLYLGREYVSFRQSL